MCMIRVDNARRLANLVATATDHDYVISRSPVSQILARDCERAKES